MERAVQGEAAMTDGADGLLFRAKGGICLAGGGPFDDALLSRALGFAPSLICADGGADRIGERVPDWIIGDGDSLLNPAAWRDRLGDRVTILADQETTDLEKCLSRVDAPHFVGVGFLGGRLDHELAALHALIADQRRILLLGAEDAVISAGRGVAFDMAVGERVSILPLRPVRAVSSRGLRWLIDGMALEMGGRIGSSNAASGTRVEMRFDAPGAVIIVPASRLEALLFAEVMPGLDAENTENGGRMR